MAYDFNGLVKDKYTLALLRFNDENDPLKDDCGNAWEYYNSTTDTTLQATLESDSAIQGGCLFLNQEGAIRTESINTEYLFNDDFTIDFWVKGDSSNKVGFKTLISCGADSSSLPANSTDFMTSGIHFSSNNNAQTINFNNSHMIPGKSSNTNIAESTSVATSNNGIDNLGKLTSWNHLAFVRYYNAFIIFFNGSPITTLKSGTNVSTGWYCHIITGLSKYLYIGNRTKPGTATKNTKQRLRIKNLRISNVARWTGMKDGSNTTTTTFKTSNINSEIINDDMITTTTDPSGLYKDFYTRSLLIFDEETIMNNILHDKTGLEWECSGNVYLSGRNALSGKGLHLNGANSKVKLKENFRFGGEDLTVDFWMYRPRSMLQGSISFCFYNSKSLKNDCFILYSVCPQDSKHLNLYYNGKDEHIGDKNDDVDQKAYNKLDHFAFVYIHNTKKITIYLNGHFVESISNFNLEDTIYDNMYIGYATPDILKSVTRAINFYNSCTIDNFRISNIARWNNEFYNGLDLNGKYKSGRTIYDNIRESQIAENPYAISPIKKDAFTLALLHFDDANDPYKDECGNTWTGYGNTSTPELPFTTDFHAVYGNSCITFNNNKKQAIVLSNPDGSLLEFGGEDFTIDMWVYSNGNVPVGARIFSIYNTSSKGISLSNRYSSTTNAVYPVLYGNSLSEADTSTDTTFAGGRFSYYNTYLCGRKVHMAVVYYYHQKCLVYYQDGKAVLRITDIIIPKTQWPQITIGAIYTGSTFYNYFLGEIDDFRISNIARYTGEFDIEPGDTDPTYTEEKKGYTNPDLNDEDLTFLMRFDKKFKTDPDDTIWLDWKQGIEMQQGSVINKDLINNPKNTNTTTFTTLVPAGLKYDNREIYSRNGNACWFDGSSYLRSATPVTLPEGDWTIDWFEYDLSTGFVTSGVFCLLPKSSSFNSRNTNFPTASTTSKASIISVGRTADSRNNLLYCKTKTTCYKYSTSSYNVATQYIRLFDTIKGRVMMSGANYYKPVASTKIDYSIGSALDGSNKSQLLHWAIVKKGNTLSVYRQGQKTFIFDAGVDEVSGVDPDKKLNDFAGTYDLYLGIAPADGTNNMASDTNLRKKAMYYTFKGYIDDFRISNKALFTTNFDVLPHPKPENFYQCFEAF